ncbi:uncharacterized protein LOC133200837 [Saccostrea echinata]|uniref:uncharacterized protein LOC133200837 n=1 Tax=Saccostrea echinata TaxID=191078 RepID=UPI002A80705F|nr:uncharacterized protein LOC133200837 [Saccostrea echinata]
MDSPHLSEAVFVGLCNYIGTSRQISMRREVWDIRQSITNQVNKEEDNYEMWSGSRKEGFRLASSDMDWMFSPKDHRVIWNLCQIKYYTLLSKTLILSECQMSPPGFVLLQLLSPSYRGFLREIISACVEMESRYYISSSIYRQITCSKVFPFATVHGPCGSSNYGIAGVECDAAQCLTCDIWPPIASSFITRSSSWPESHILGDIVKGGCHFVAIGHKLSVHEDKEWRISFSLAEQKLVYSMNHCQFLTYALLKLFLKNVINSETEEKLLCSYHMKTAVFWVIQQNIVPIWSPQNLLECFWICFKMILKWVYDGVCPNFFIPENNMFLCKIHGHAQKTLLIRLCGLYEKGNVSLQHIPSIRCNILHALQNPSSFVSVDEHLLLPDTNFDVEMFTEIATVNFHRIPHLNTCWKHLKAISVLRNSNLTKCQFLTI